MPPIVWPLLLTASRLVLGPCLLALAARGVAGPWLVACLYAAIVSDIFDGILARQLGVATPWLRRFDSQSDVVFWLCALGSVGIAHPQILREGWPLIVAMVVLEAATYAFSLAKFGREHCTHAYSAKVWGLVLLATFTAMLGFGEGRISLRILFATYLLSWADVLAILWLLPRWESDVPSFYHAWRIRRGLSIRRHKLFH